MYSYSITNTISCNIALIFGVSTSEPNIDRDNAPHALNNGLYLYRTLVPKTCVRHKISGILMCSHVWFATALEQQGQLKLLVSAMKIIDEDK